MRRNKLLMSILILFFSVSAASCKNKKIDQPLPGKEISANPDITYPLTGSLFPADMIAPTFSWKYEAGDITGWEISITVGDREICKEKTTGLKWQPDTNIWELLKEKYKEQDILFTVQGNRGGSVLKDTIRIKISRDKVDAKIFYRDVPLPFIYAYKNLETIRWRLGDVSSEKPAKILMEKLPLCGNCHSFSADGQKMAMDIDYANDKGSYIITDIKKETALTWEQIITWSSYKRLDGDLTFGLLSQLSADGRYAISTVKDHSVFVPKDDLFYSQLFFPLKGILAVYDTIKKEFYSLPGADDPEYVQSNPGWSPDNSYIVFAKAPAYHSEEIDKSASVLLNPAIVADFIEGRRLFKFDLYKIPFNNGKGGKAEPIPGASANGLSNYFPKISPNGKWLVFCRANSFMLLQPDSKLYIMPTSGGEPREMTCNTERMNSWHSWSPNGKWLIFTSKARGAYTQLYITHIDENGQDTPAVLLENLVIENRAVNIPEFVNLQGKAWEKIVDKFSSSSIYDVRIADAKVMDDDFAGAVKNLSEAIRKNPKDPSIFYRRGFIKMSLGDITEAIADFSNCIALDPKYPLAYENRGYAYSKLEQYDKAMSDLNKAIELQPNLLTALISRGEIKARFKQFDAAMQDFDRAISVNPKESSIYKSRGDAYLEMEKVDRAVADFNKALQINPEFYLALASRAAARAKIGDSQGAFADMEKALLIKPGDFNLYIFRGIIKERTGDMNGAAADFSKAIEINPKSYKGYYRRAGINMRKNAAVEAFSDINRAISLNPENAVLHLTRGNFYLIRREMQKAVTELDKAIALDPKNATAYSYKGDALYVLKNLPGAQTAFSRAITLNPEDGDNYFKRGVIRLSLRQNESACQDLRRAQELGQKRAVEFIDKYCK